MSEEFKTPDPGEGIHEVEIVEIHVAEGDRVAEGDALFAVESDKATVDVPASFSGVVASIEVAEGDVVEVGSVLLTYDSGGESAGSDGSGRAPQDDAAEGSAAASAEAADEDSGADERQDSPEQREDPEPDDTAERRKKTRKTGSQDADEDTAERGGRPGAASSAEIEASPATRRLARELDIDLSDVAGSGPGGRVLGRDVRTAVRHRDGPRPQGAEPALPDPARWGDTSREPLRGVRRAVARQMMLSWQHIPHVTHTQRVDVTRLEAFRREHAGEAAGKLTLTVLVVKALAAALRRFPRFNAALDNRSEEIVYKHYCHIGVAVATADGLLVPVLRDVDRKPLVELAGDLEGLSEAARERRLAADDMRGGCMSVTNVGGVGGDHFTPIINHPESAILGVGALREVPALVRNEEGAQTLEARLELPLILAVDHRLNDGIDAARFTNAIAEALADPEQLLLAA